MNFKHYCVFDFETDSPDPSVCSPVQIAALIVDARKLEAVEKAEFVSDMRPPDIDDDDYFDNHKKTILWHAREMNTTTTKVVERWKRSPEQRHVWESFCRWLSQYHDSQKRQSKFSAPVPCGYNILSFDIPIAQRMCDKYGYSEKTGHMKIFNPRDKVDLMLQMFWIFENQHKPEKYNMKEIREYLNISPEGAHDAFKDVKDEAEILIKFLKAQRWLTSNLIKQGKLK